MANFPITNHAVFPTQADINGGTPGLGTVWTETNAALLFRALSLFVNRIESGFDPPSTGGTLTKSIPGGEALISGRRVKGTAGNNVTFDASATNHLYLQLLLDANGVVTGLQLVTNTTGTKPANSVKIATVVTNASSVTAVTDYRPEGRLLHGRIIRSGGDWIVDDNGSGDWANSGAQINFNAAFRRTPHVWLQSNHATAFAYPITVSASSVNISADTTTGIFVNFLVWL